jgi:hypothetical protein
MLLLFRSAEWKLAKELSADLPAGTALFGVLQMTGLKDTGVSVNNRRGNGSAAHAGVVEEDGAADGGRLGGGGFGGGDRNGFGEDLGDARPRYQEAGGDDVRFLCRAVIALHPGAGWRWQSQVPPGVQRAVPLGRGGVRLPLPGSRRGQEPPHSYTCKFLEHKTGDKYDEIFFCYFKFTLCGCQNPMRYTFF